jgi:hypothetical protein
LSTHPPPHSNLFTYNKFFNNPILSLKPSILHPALKKSTSKSVILNSKINTFFYDPRQSILTFSHQLKRAPSTNNTLPSNNIPTSDKSKHNPFVFATRHMTNLSFHNLTTNWNPTPNQQLLLGLVSTTFSQNPFTLTPPF